MFTPLYQERESTFGSCESVGDDSNATPYNGQGTRRSQARVVLTRNERGARAARKAPHSSAAKERQPSPLPFTAMTETHKARKRSRVTNVAHEIYTNLLKCEQTYALVSEGRLPVPFVHRTKVVRWFFDMMVANAQRQTQEAVHLAVAYFDRYLGLNPLAGDKKMIAVVCYAMACKFNDTKHPRLVEVAECTNLSVTQAEVAEVEWRVLAGLDYRINIPTSLVFLGCYANQLDADGLQLSEEQIAVARFVCDVSLLSYECAQFPASDIALSALMLAVATCPSEQFPSVVELRNRLQTLKPDVEQAIDRVRTPLRAALRIDLTEYMLHLHAGVARQAVVETSVEGNWFVEPMQFHPN